MISNVKGPLSIKPKKAVSSASERLFFSQFYAPQRHKGNKVNFLKP
jgi:hypothetical protein